MKMVWWDELVPILLATDIILLPSNIKETVTTTHSEVINYIVQGGLPTVVWRGPPGPNNGK